MSEEGFREREVLRARRESLERLRGKGIEPFALNLESVLGVREPHRIEDVREEFGALGPVSSVQTCARWPVGSSSSGTWAS